MNRQIAFVLKSVKERTGIDVILVSEGFTEVYPSDAAVKFQPPVKDFNTVFCDADSSRTYFKVYSGGTQYIGSIEGSTENQRINAYLISSMLENLPESAEVLTVAEKLKKLLNGELTRGGADILLSETNKKDGAFYVLALLCDRNTDLVKNYLSGHAEENDFLVTVTEDSVIAVIKSAERDPESLLPVKFAEKLRENIRRSVGIAPLIGVGSNVESFFDARISYQQAIDAIKTGVEFFPSDPVHSYASCMLIKLLQEVPKIKLGEFEEMLLDKNGRAIMDDKVMIETAEAFFDNDLNLSETSRKLYMHRNTLMYRLDKIERGTGLNIKKFSDALTFRIITIIRKILS